MRDQTFTWVLQSNAIGASDYAEILDHLRALGVRVEEIRVIPFSHEAPSSRP